MTKISPRITLGEYLILRILQANPKLKSIFGVPGDYNLKLMELLYEDTIANDVKFIGCCNELNAAYAADGYARAIDQFAVLITTMGVGELSAINGVASAFSEYVPLLHIVGVTSTAQVAQAHQCDVGSIKNYHHLLQNKNPLLPPDHDAFKKMVADISVASETLTADGFNNEENLDRIDFVLSTIMQESRPGYLFLPSDLSTVMVSSERLSETPFTFQVYNKHNRAASELLEKLTHEVLSLLYDSHTPAVMGDDLIKKYHSRASFDKLVSKLEHNKFVKLYSTGLGKCVNEESPNFVGTYGGKLGREKHITESLESETDLLVIFGYSNFETNTLYTEDFSRIKTVVYINPDYVRINDEIYNIKYQKSGMRLFTLTDLVEHIETTLDVARLKDIDNVTRYAFDKIPRSQDTNESRVVSQNDLVDFLNGYIQPNDIIMTDMSCFAFEVPKLHFKKNVTAIYNSYYSSIGYALPAALGVTIGLQDTNTTDTRVLVMLGDGSVQMTAQEMSSFLRYDALLPQLFLMNNEGYSIERGIMGETQPYNDIQYWHWDYMLKGFGDPQCEKHLYKNFKTFKDFKEYFAGDCQSDKLEFYDIWMSKFDYSDTVKLLGSRARAAAK